MAEAKRKRGRPKKHVGLATPKSLKKAVDGEELRDLRASDVGQERPVLLDAQTGQAQGNGKRRIFGAVDDPDADGKAQALTPPVLDVPGRQDAFDLRLTDVLKQIALEQAAPEFQEGDRVMTNIELLARKLWYTALSNTTTAQRTREFIVERLEGKAGRAAPPQGTNRELEEQLDRQAIEALNALAAGNEDENGTDG